MRTKRTSIPNVMIICPCASDRVAISALDGRVTRVFRGPIAFIDRLSIFCTSSKTAHWFCFKSYGVIRKPEDQRRWCWWDRVNGFAGSFDVTTFSCRLFRDICNSDWTSGHRQGNPRPVKNLAISAVFDRVYNSMIYTDFLRAQEMIVTKWMTSLNNYLGQE
jgi:hypothetical protein